MRKKYLSALLFGALLFASAGTFTSCKDYDDDIDNLSQRIDQVASDLNDLKTKVDALGGYVENVSFADGVLSVTTGGNTVTYNIPDKTGVNEVTLALDGNNLVLTVDGEAQTIALPAGETGEVEIPEIEVKDGVLYINGEPQTLKVDVESNVTVIESTIPGNETYTVMVNGEEVTFAKAFADVRISLVNRNGGDDFYFTDAAFANTDYHKYTHQDGNKNTIVDTPDYKQEHGIHWTILSQDVKWDGPKGDLKAGLVVGQTTAAEVSVRPINYDLTTAKLTLVSSKGVEAPVTVVPTKGMQEGPLSNGTRSADVNYNSVNQGDYVLTLQFNKFTAGSEDEEMISKFANETQTGNIKYALAVNGVVATDYNFIIDTQVKADAQASCESVDVKKFVIGGKGEVEAIDGKDVVVVKGIPTDGKAHRMTYLDGRIYDMKVAINASDVADAEVYGLTVDTKAGTIAAGANAVDRVFALDVTLINVNGKTSSKTIYIKFADSESQVITLDANTFKVVPTKDKSLLVDVGDTFSSLSAADAISINSLKNITWAIENDDEHFLWPLDESTLGARDNFDGLNYRVTDGATYNRIKYYDEKMNDIDMSDDKIDEAVRSIRYVKFVRNDENYANTEATTGEHVISVTIKRDISASDQGDGATRLVKKVNVPVHVTLPSWDDVFVTTTDWSEGNFVTRVVGVDGNKVKVSMFAFDENKEMWGAETANEEAKNINLSKLVYVSDGNNEVKFAATGEDLKEIGKGLMDLDKVVVTNYLETGADYTSRNEIKAKAEYTIGDVENFKISKSFSVQIKSLFEDAALSYYDMVSGAPVQLDHAILNSQNYTIRAGVTANNSIIGEGLILGLAKNYVGVNTTNLPNGLGAPYLWNNANKFVLKASTSSSSSYNEIEYAATADASGVTGTTTATVTANGITIENNQGQVGDNTTGTLTLKFTDIMGIKTTASIGFQTGVVE